MIRDLLLIYLTGVVLCFVIFSDEFDHGEAWVVLLWPVLVVGTIMAQLSRAVRSLWPNPSNNKDCPNSLQ